MEPLWLLSIPVIKSQLVLRLAGYNPHLHQRDVEKLVATILDEIVLALGRGDRVELRGFGSFSVKRRRVASLLVLPPMTPWVVVD